MTQMREEAANTLKRAKSSAKNRLSTYSVSNFLTSPSNSTAAKPLASTANASGYFDTTISPSRKESETSLSQERLSDGDLSPDTVKGDHTPVNSVADSAINHLRDSLSRNGSSHKSRNAASSAEKHSEKDAKISTISKSLAEKRFTTLQAVEETASSAEQSRDETFSSFTGNSP